MGLEEEQRRFGKERRVEMITHNAHVRNSQKKYNLKKKECNLSILLLRPWHTATAALSSQDTHRHPLTHGL